MNLSARKFTGYEETSRPWIKGQVHTPAAKDPAPGAARLRPLIWVYELPADYNSLLLQYRVERCERWLTEFVTSALHSAGLLFPPPPRFLHAGTCA